MASIDESIPTARQPVSDRTLDIRGHRFFNARPVLAVKPLSGGLNNRLFKVTTECGQWVCRENLDGTHHNNERQIQQQAAQLGLAAKILHWSNDPSDPLNIFEFIDGQHLKAKYWPAQQLSQFAAKLAQLHQQIDHQRPSKQWPQLDLVEQLQHYQRQLDNSTRHRYDEQINSLIHRLRSPHAQPHLLGLCHNDLNHLNIIYQAKDHNTIIIDWEFAAIGEVFFDLAGFISEHQLSDSQRQAFIHDYFAHTEQSNQDPSKVAAKLQLYQEAYKLICKLWYIIRRLDPT